MRAVVLVGLAGIGTLIGVAAALALNPAESSSYWTDTGLYWVDITEGQMNCTLSPYLPSGVARIGGFVEIQVMDNDIDLYLRSGGVTYASAARPAGYAAEAVFKDSPAVPVGWSLCAYGFNVAGTSTVAGGYELLSTRW